MIALGTPVPQESVLKAYIASHCTQSGILMEESIRKISFTMAFLFAKNSASKISSHFSTFGLHFRVLLLKCYIEEQHFPLIKGSETSLLINQAAEWQNMS